MRGYKEPRGTAPDGGRRWRLRINLGRRPDGTRATYSEAFKGSARDADRRIAELVAGFDELANLNRRKTFGQLVTEWREVVAPSLADSTRRGYLANLERYVLPRLAEVPVAKITAGELERLYRELEAGRAPGTVHQVHAVISALLTTAVRWEWIDRNPARATKRTTIPWQPPRITDATHDEIRRVLGAIDEPAFRVAALLTAATGMRRGELCGLRWSDLELEAGVLRIERAIDVVPTTREVIVKSTKTHAVREIHLDAGTVELLRAHWAWAADYALEAGVMLEPLAYVFSDHPAGSEPWRPDRVTWAWRRARAASGVKGVRFHDLRHYHATEVLAATDSATARDRLGHRDMSTTNRYAHGRAAADQRAADAVGARVRELGR
jgi:integrase